MTTDPHSQVRVFEQAPSPVLRAFVQRFLVVEYRSAHRDAHLPELGPIAAFTFRGRCLLDGRQWAPAAALTGLRDTQRRHEHSDGYGVALAHFTPTGAHAFLRPSLDEFSGLTTDLTGILGRASELEELTERLAESPNQGGRVALLERFLLARLRLTVPDPLVSAAVAWIDGTSGGGRIDELTRHIGLSQSALERRFRRVVGLSPKRFTSLVRFRHAARLLEAGGAPASVAQQAGYFDQSHMINEFRRSTGRPPAAYFRGGMGE